MRRSLPCWLNTRSIGLIVAPNSTVSVLPDALLQPRRQTENEFRRGVLGQLTDAETKPASVAQELVKADQRYGLQKLTAPNDGLVQQLAVNTLGGVVTAAQALMVVVPSRVTLEAEAMVLNRDVGLCGSVSPPRSSSRPSRSPGTGRSEARSAMSRLVMNVDGKEVDLGPGMATTVEIKTDQRRLIEYLLSPLLRYK